MKLSKQAIAIAAIVLMSSIIFGTTIALWSNNTTIGIGSGVAMAVALTCVIASIYYSLRLTLRSIRRQDAASKTILKEISRVLYHSREANHKSGSIVSASERLRGLEDKLIPSRGQSSEELLQKQQSEVRATLHSVQAALVELKDYTRGQTSSIASDSPGGGTATNIASGSVTPELSPPVSAPTSTWTPASPPQPERQPISGDDLVRWKASRTGGAAFTLTRDQMLPRRKNVPFANEIPVAMLADDFTFNSFKSEFDVTRISPSGWRAQFEKIRPAFFFCESAWQGGSPADHPWQGKVYASVRWPQENRQILLQIIKYCRERNIPTVFWNKEDPTHFSDRINDFVRTAALFDYVFTTAEECVDGYRKYAGARHADVLPFAVQPKIFNPLGRRQESNTVNFAGTWYAKYEERSTKAAKIMDLVQDAGHELIIYNRMYNNKSPIYRYPERFADSTRPAIPYIDTAHAYRGSQFGITLNTVDQSKTMFARRIFELAACGAVVLSNDAVGVRNFFGESVIYADTEPERFLQLSETEYFNLQRQSMTVALNNTYTHRAQKVLDTLGIEYQDRYVPPTGLARVSTIHAYENAIAEVQSSRVMDSLLVVTEDEGQEGLQFEAMRRRDNGVTVISGEELARGEYRSRNYLDAAGVVVSDRNGRFASDDHMEWLALHSSYETESIISADSNRAKFRYGMTQTLTDSYIPTHKLVGAYSSDTPVETYWA